MKRQNKFLRVHVISISQVVYYKQSHMTHVGQRFGNNAMTIYTEFEAVL